MIKTKLRALNGIKEDREGRKITYRDIADETGIGLATVSNWMNNRVKFFSTSVLEKFCRYYCCQPGDILVMVEVEK